MLLNPSLHERDDEQRLRCNVQQLIRVETGRAFAFQKIEDRVQDEFDHRENETTGDQPHESRLNQTMGQQTIDP